MELLCIPESRPPALELTLLFLIHAQARPGSHKLRLGSCSHLWPPAQAKAQADLGTPTCLAVAPLTRKAGDPAWGWADPGVGACSLPFYPGYLRPPPPGSQHELFSSQIKGSQDSGT